MAEFKDNIWEQKLKATVSIKKGNVIFASTPLTENDVFYSLVKL